ncbi:MAG: hypothetical protein WAX77_04320 [Methylococcaceae bacterium]
MSKKDNKNVNAIIKHIVIDTTVLLELYKIDRKGNKAGTYYTEKTHQEVTKLFDEADEKDYRFYFPIPVLFEFASHIADSSNRQEKSKCLIGLVEDCQNDDFYQIVPCSDANTVDNLIKDLIFSINRFDSDFLSYSKITLTNVSIITQVELLIDDIKKNKRTSHKVEVWTTNQSILNFLTKFLEDGIYIQDVNIQDIKI